MLRLLSIPVFFGLLFPVSVQAQSGPPTDEIRRFANRALATFGLVAVPSDTASFLSINQTGGDENSFRSSQLGGGFTLPDGRPIYLEGYLGYQRYDPRFIIDLPIADIEVRAKWAGLAASGGIGYDFRIDRNWVFRPIVNVALGRIASEVSVRPPFTATDLGPDSEFLQRGEIIAGGLGGALVVEYTDVQPNRELEFRLRQSFMKLKSIGSSSYLNAEADVVTSSAWARLRQPLGDLSAFGSPVRSVLQASVTGFNGDQSEILGTSWLAKVGAGIELGNSGDALPVRGQLRLLLSYAFGENYKGYSVGLGFNF